MNVLEKILVLLDGQMTRPTDYGWFHIMFLIIMILVIVFLSVKYKNPTEKQRSKILLICSSICLLFEVYKQINFSFNYEGNLTWWHYQWYAFPFQFCSTPMYIAFIASFCKKGKFRTCLYAFLATYGLLGGLSAMVYPNTVFIETIGINIQTMVHHGMQVVMGMFIITSKSIKFNLKTIIHAFYVFISLIIIALIINIATYYLGIDNGLEMFFISPFHVSSLPVFSIIYPKVPYLVFLLIYISIFTIGTSLPIFISYIIEKINIKK